MFDEIRLIISSSERCISWIHKVQEYVNLVDLFKSFHTSIYYLLANIGFDTAENEPANNLI